MIRDPECPELDPVCDQEIARSAAAVIELRDANSLDERKKVLDKYGLVEGRRHRCR